MLKTTKLEIDITYHQGAAHNHNQPIPDSYLDILRVLTQGVLLDLGRKLVEEGFHRDSVIRVMQEQGLPYPTLRQIDQHPRGPDVS